MDEIQPTDTASNGVSRRNVLLGAAAATAAVAAAPMIVPTSASAQTNSAKSAGDTPADPKQPNVLIILVDEMRFPKVFPSGVKNAADFLQKFMPNTYSLWRRGVKFGRHHSNANDCSPSRGVFMTGMYSQQSWMLTTMVDSGSGDHASSPVLNRAYPTYGKLMRQAGYQTPYIGKWHLSALHEDQKDPDDGYLEGYGFDGKMWPDPTGTNLQGTYTSVKFPSDGDIAALSAEWLQTTTPKSQPWCLTVGFVNPHDKEFFPAGTEFQTFDELFTDSTKNPNNLQPYFVYGNIPNGNAVSWRDNALKNPPPYGYAELPPNWETYAELANKPGYHQVVRQFQALVFGGVHEDAGQKDFVIEPYPLAPSGKSLGQGIGLAPFHYWQRSLDSYTQIMEVLDTRVGEVLDAIPDDVAENTIVIFASDHGDFAGAHGMVSGKTGTVYDEAIRVPFIVMDPTGRYTGDINTVRTGLSAHVDVLPMLVSIANGGSQSWMKGDLKELYATRHNMLPMLKSADAPGRDYVLHSNDEILLADYNFNEAPWHVTGLVTDKGKLGLYSFWNRDCSMRRAGQQSEYYNYGTRRGRLEVHNTNDSAAAKRATKVMMESLIPNEMRRPLPKRLRPAAAHSRATTALFYTLGIMSAAGD